MNYSLDHEVFCVIGALCPTFRQMSVSIKAEVGLSSPLIGQAVGD